MKKKGHSKPLQPVAAVLRWWQARRTLAARVGALERTQRLIIGRLNVQQGITRQSPQEPPGPTIAPPVAPEAGQINLLEIRRSRWGSLGS